MRTRWIIAAILVLTGVVWVGQGTGLIRGSGFMDGDMRWAFAGVVCIAVAVVLGWAAFKARPNA